MWTKNFQMYKLGFRESEDPEIKLTTFVESWRKQGNSRKKTIYFCFIDYTKAFDCKDHNKLWKILKKMELPDLPTWLLRKVYAGKKQ